MINPDNKAAVSSVEEQNVLTSRSLEQNLDAFMQFGGFDLLEGSIEGVQNLNPERKARKNIFLSESSKKAERNELKTVLKLWADTLKTSDSLLDLVEECEKKSEQSERTLKKNLAIAVDESKELEESYRTLQLFFKNTEESKVKNIAILNAELDQLKDLDNSRFIDHIQEELVNGYDRLDLRQNYALLVIPGYLGSNKVIEKWAKIAYDNKVMLVTDFQHLDEPDDVMEMFEAANLTGGDTYRSNVMMTCNWLVGRGKHDEIEEQDHLYIAPSAALAGKVYNTLMSQVTAGKKYGGINEVDGVKFDLKKSEIANLENLGLIPMVNEYGKVMAFSGKTLFNGDNLGLQTYSVVRVFDYVTKVLMDFLNRRAFENFNAKTRKEILNQIVKFLDNVSGPDKLIEDFEIKRFEQDINQKDRIFLDIRLKPYFPAKNFLIKMDGQKGDEGNDWDTEYAES
ncbi:MAG: type VI secretion system contractile sheath protein TssC [Flavobacterium psychrophilum]|nr:MAG: type VI secretion system contractile sheath protein TssC [Flavobacterium psychrophilum]